MTAEAITSPTNYDADAAELHIVNNEGEGAPKLGEQAMVRLFDTEWAPARHRMSDEQSIALPTPEDN